MQVHSNTDVVARIIHIFILDRDEPEPEPEPNTPIPIPTFGTLLSHFFRPIKPSHSALHIYFILLSS